MAVMMWLWWSAYEEQNEEVAHGDRTISRLRERRDSLEKQLRDKEHREHKIQVSFIGVPVTLLNFQSISRCYLK